MNEDWRLLLDRLRCFFDKVNADPLSGEGCVGRRVCVATPLEELPRAYVPLTMPATPEYAAVQGDAVLWKRLRCRHDFEYWAVTCAVIKDKSGGCDIPFVLNPPQRRVLALLEADRLAGLPLRLILLKARQWGGSTLIQMYMAWIQTCLRTNWNSAIVAHVKDTSATIRGMYTKLLSRYPPELWEGSAEAKFVPFEGSANIRTLNGRDCNVGIGTAEKPDSLRGGDLAMVHLSETAFWPRTPGNSPLQVVQAVCGGVSRKPYTLVAIESTARGVGDYFHKEWLRNKAGRGDKHAVFVPWFEISLYTEPCVDAAALFYTLSPYEMRLVERGATSENLCWYRNKVREVEQREDLASEYPSDDVEAFCSSRTSVFPSAAVEKLRAACTAPLATGDVSADGHAFHADARGLMKLWSKPVSECRYVVAVDVGGRSSKSDWSVVAVLSVPERAAELPRVVAQWRGHIDHDLLAAKSVAVARYYNNAFLVIESNTYETSDFGSSSDSNIFILNRLAETYSNVYRRESFDTLKKAASWRIGFHTNVSTKKLLINNLIEVVREGLYVERDAGACNELLTYEQLESGAFAARDGCHDDMLMTRAIALYVISSRQVPARLPSTFEQHQRW